MTEAVVAQRNTVSAVGFANPLNLPANAENDVDVKVYGDDVLLTLGVDYTLAGVGDTGDLDEIAGVNAIIQPATLLAGYDSYTIEHDPPDVQDFDLSAGGRLGALYEKALDAIIRIVQSVVQTAVDRSPRLPPSAIDVDLTLPHPENRRGLVWVLDQDTGVYALENTVSDPDTEPLTSAVAQAAAAAASAATATAQAQEATDQAQQAADSADRAEAAAAEAGDLSALLNYLWPVGALMEFAGAAAPSNFLACNGQAVSRTTYSALFGVIGTTYGAGNGATTFTLPQFNDGRFRRGVGGTAAAQGVEQAEMIGPHNHDATIASGGAHTHDLSLGGRYGANAGFIGPRWGAGDRSSGSGSATTSSSGEHTHTATIANNSGTENRPRNSSALVCIKY